MEPATAGDSILQATLSPVITGLNHDLRLPWGSRPRLYAYACFAGWAIVQNLGMRSLPGRIDFLCKAPMNTTGTARIIDYERGVLESLLAVIVCAGEE